MDKSEYWKNFSLGTELEISGNFIYNGLKAFDEIEYFHSEEEIFEFLYNISVGLERLEKIAVILMEHNNIIDQAEFEKSLLTHNHMELIKRIRNKYNLNLSSSHNSFIQLLTEFYQSYRYDRFILNESLNYDKERVDFINFLQKYLNIKIEYKKDFQLTPNDDGIKKFIGKIIGKFCEHLYDIVYKEASNLNIYTWEIRYNSKAYKIFLRKEYNFIKEKVLLKELLIYFLNTKDKTRLLSFMKEIDHLDFDAGLIEEYIDGILNNSKLNDIIDEFDELYKNIDNSKERLELLDMIGNNNIMWDSFESEN